MNLNDVVSWFLSHGDMTQKKIHQLCYYAQAWHIALLDRALFDNKIEAWVHGAVFPDLVSQYGNYMYDVLPIANKPIFEDDTESLLNAVYNTYNPFTEDQLETLIRHETPWQLARGDIGVLDNCTNPIQETDMKQFYSNAYREAYPDSYNIGAMEMSQ